jgi:hypothetical protein
LTSHLADVEDILCLHETPPGLNTLLRSAHYLPRYLLARKHSSIAEPCSGPRLVSLRVKAQADFPNAMQAPFARGMRTLRLSAADLLTEAKAKRYVLASKKQSLALVNHGCYPRAICAGRESSRTGKVSFSVKATAPLLWTSGKPCGRCRHSTSR